MHVLLYYCGQALELGYWLRQQYIDSLGYLPASYRPGVLAARTTNFSRTRATLAGVLTGLYPGASLWQSV